MSPSIRGETLITLAEAARPFPGHRGGRLHPVTLTRWILRGCRSPAGQRVYLEAVRCGSRWLTSEAALARFMEALTDHVRDAPGPPEVRSPTARLGASQDAARELDRLGA